MYHRNVCIVCNTMMDAYTLGLVQTAVYQQVPVGLVVGRLIENLVDVIAYVVFLLCNTMSKLAI